MQSGETEGMCIIINLLLQCIAIFISEANEEEEEGANEEQEENKGDDGAAEVILVYNIGS